MTYKKHLNIVLGANCRIVSVNREICRHFFLIEKVKCHGCWSLQPEWPRLREGCLVLFGGQTLSVNLTDQQSPAPFIEDYQDRSWGFPWTLQPKPTPLTLSHVGHPGHFHHAAPVTQREAESFFFFLSISLSISSVITAAFDGLLTTGASLLWDSASERTPRQGFDTRHLLL